MLNTARNLAASAHSINIVAAKTLRMDTELLLEATGWIGVVSYVLAYLLLTIGVLKPSGYRFHLLNMAGAASLILYSLEYGDKPNVAVNFIWLMIGIGAVGRKLARRSAGDR